MSSSCRHNKKLMKVNNLFLVEGAVDFIAVQDHLIFLKVKKSVAK